MEADRLRWTQSDGLCKRCDLNVLDNFEHYILNCTYFQHARCEMFQDIENKLSVYDCTNIRDFFANDSNQTKFNFLVGDI